MVTVLVVCERPARASAREAASCIRAEAGKLLAFAGTASVTVTALRMAFADFMGELRSLRAHPIAVVADATTAISFSRAMVP